MTTPYQLADIAILANHKVKMKENEKQDLARDPKKICNMNGMIPVEGGAVRTVLNNPEKSLGEL